MNFRPPSGKKSRKAVVVRYITDSEGTLQSFNPEGPKHIRGVVFSRIFKEIGAAIKPPTNNLDSIGVVITKARTPDEADEIADKKTGPDYHDSTRHAGRVDIHERVDPFGQRLNSMPSAHPANPQRVVGFTVTCLSARTYPSR
jgi:hypothetical protein